MKCVLCSGKIEGRYGHNAEPLAKGRCCATCNDTIVVPARIRIHFKGGLDMIHLRTQGTGPERFHEKKLIRDINGRIIGIE